MFAVKKTSAPNHKNHDEYWWCGDDSSNFEPYPVLIQSIRKKDGSYWIWYEVAGSDEGMEIDKAIWYGKVGKPKIEND